jgi:mycothiol synthase
MEDLIVHATTKENKMSTTKRYIEHPSLTAVPGLALRHFAGEDDYQIMLDLWLQTRQFNGYEWSANLDDMKQDEHWRQHYDINEQLIFIETDAKPIGYLAYDWDEEIATTENPAQYVFGTSFILLEEYWDGAIPRLMLAFVEDRQREVAAGVPDDKPKWFSVWKKEIAHQSLAFFKANGYEPQRYFFMMNRPIDKPLGEHPLPEELQLRPVTPAEYRKVWDADHAAFRDHWGYVEPTEEQYQNWLKDRNFQPHLWKVAWSGDEIVGMVGNFFDEKENQEYNRKRGYTEDISVHKDWRCRGLAKALIAESIRMFKEMGMEHTTLGVDAQNPNGALNLYTSMGYEVDKARTSMVLRKQL